MPPRLNHLQAYLAQEFIDDYNQGYMTRRQMLARIVGITGGIGSAATLLLMMGCRPVGQTSPPAGQPITPQSAQASPTAAAAAPTVSGSPPPPATPDPARSRLSVKPDDPAITANDVTFQGNGITQMAYLAQPRAGGPFPGLLVCHENRGLVEHIRDVTRRLGKAGYAALALDLLSRDGGTAKVDPAQAPGKLTADPARNMADFQSAYEYLRSLSQVQKDKIGMIGFCFGGAMTWLMATAIPGLKAAVPFYGVNPPLEDVPKIRAAVLAIYGGNDQRVNAGIPAIEEAMRANNKTFEMIVYPGAAHAFHNDTGPAWNEQAAEDAWQKALDWFRKYLA